MWVRIVLEGVKGEKMREFGHVFENDEPSFGHLTSKVSEWFSIPAEYQHISIKGQQVLVRPEVSLKSLGINDEAVISVKHACLYHWEAYVDIAKKIANDDALSTAVLSKEDKNKLAVKAYGCEDELQKSQFFKAYSSCIIPMELHREVIGPYLDSETSVIKVAAENYFSAFYQQTCGGQAVSFDWGDKKKEKGGESPGVLCYVTVGGQTDTYHIKTHYRGPYFGAVMSRGKPDLKEAFAYKLLQLIRVAPEVHFLSNVHSSALMLYIATKGISIIEAEKAAMSERTLIQAHLLEQLLHLVDLHQMNFGEQGGSIAIVDFAVSTPAKYREENGMKVVVEKRYTTTDDLLIYNFGKGMMSKLPFNTINYNVLRNIGEEERFATAKKSLMEWNFLEKISEADASIGTEKKRLRKAGVNIGDTNDYIEYLNGVRDNVNVILNHKA